MLTCPIGQWSVAYPIEEAIYCNKLKYELQQTRDVTRSGRLKSCEANEKASVAAGLCDWLIERPTCLIYQNNYYYSMLLLARHFKQAELAQTERCMAWISTNTSVSDSLTTFTGLMEAIFVLLPVVLTSCIRHMFLFLRLIPWRTTNRLNVSLLITVSLL